jgi:hypothetical protein
MEIICTEWKLVFVTAEQPKQKLLRGDNGRQTHVMIITTVRFVDSNVRPKLYVLISAQVYSRPLGD